MSMEEDVGYIKALIERNTKDVDELKSMWREHLKIDMENMKEIQQSIESLEDRLDFYKHFIWFIKALGWTAVLVLTFKFGDIERLWRK